MKVSIVIPAYNEEKWIAKTLSAVQKLKYPDFEVIVVNNNSKDNTNEVVRPFTETDSRIRLIQEPRKGVLYAREAGRVAASGEIIAQLDADCLPHPQWIAIALEYFNEPDVVAVTGPYRFYDAPPLLRTTTGLGQKYIYWPASILLRTFSKGSIYVGGNFFIRASALEKIGGYDTSIDFYSDDADTGFRLSKVGKVLFEPAITIDSSARRLKAFGFNKLNKIYTRAFLASLMGKKFKDNREENHPR